MKGKYPYLENGEWTKIDGRYLRRVCCDCGLIHDYQYRIRKGVIYYRAWRNKGSTGQYRRWHKIKVKEKKK